MMIDIESIMVEPPRDDQVVNPMEWFDSPGKFELEIGCGKGGFLLSRARHQPHIRILGIEWANKIYRYCADRIARWELENARVIRTDASVFVQRHLPPECIDVLHLYHPDPWPKKRHHKRRLVQRPFVEAVVRSLKEDGYWLVQSDHPEYFEWMHETISAHPGLREIPFDSAGVTAGPDFSGTNFEIKHTQRRL